MADNKKVLHLLKKQVVRQMINRHHPPKVATLPHQTLPRESANMKKITAENYRDNNAGKSNGNKEEVKEVSQKEIDEKIKSYACRLNVSSKNKRQKIRRDSREVKREKAEQQNVADGDMKLKLTEFVSVSELASLMDVPVAEVITTCMNLGVIVSINQRLDAEVIELVANEFGHEIEFTTAESINDEEKEEEDDPKILSQELPL